MNSIERLAIEWECARLVQRYCLLVDGYRHEELVELWAPDGVWETWKGPLAGHDQMRAYLDAKPTGDHTVHMAQNIVIEVVDETRATGTASFAYYGTRRDDPAATVQRVIGRYFDRYVRTARGWRFAHRRTDMIFRSPRSPIVAGA